MTYPKHLRQKSLAAIRNPQAARPKGAEAKKDDATKTSNYPYKFEWNI